MPQDTTIRQRALLKERLSTLRPCPQGRFAGRGIVVAAGGAEVFVNAFVLVFVLRRVLGSMLPIEVWHLGRKEMSARMASLLEAEGVRVVDAEVALKRRPARIHDGWQLKIYALMESAFAEVLLLDADQVPVADPAAIFDWPEYRAKGAVFWRDLVDIAEKNPIWNACNLPPRRHPGFDSGQVLVDKRRHWQALETTLHLNEEADTYYRMVYGDKDTFLAGWLLAGHDYALVEHVPFADLRCRIQCDFKGDPLFQHRCDAKWRYRGEQRRIAGFVHHEACLAALAELRRQWNGRIFHPPARGLAARGIEASLAALRMFNLVVPGESECAIELLPDNEIGEGRDADRQNWYVLDDQDPPILVVVGGSGDQQKFAMRSVARWLGDRATDSPTEIQAAAGADTPALPTPTGLVRDLVRAAIGPAGWSAEVEGRLRVAFGLLAEADPRTGEDLLAFAAGNYGKDDPVRAGLEAVAAGLARPQEVPQRDWPSSRPTALLNDATYYQRF